MGSRQGGSSEAVDEGRNIAEGCACCLEAAGALFGAVLLIGGIVVAVLLHWFRQGT